MKSDIWKSIAGYKGYYEVSRNGSVRSIDRVVKHGTSTDRRYRGRVLKQTLNKWGYLVVTLCKKGKTKLFKVHRLVAISFIPGYNKKDRYMINHLNEVKTDNNWRNLEWSNHSLNAKHTYARSPCKKNHWSRSSNSKLNRRKIKKAFRLRVTKTQTEIADILGVNRRTINNLFLGKHYKDVIKELKIEELEK